MAFNSFLGYDPDDNGLLPDGEYVVKIDEFQKLATKKGGTMMYVKFKVAEGEKEGYEAEKRFNTHNSNHQTQRTNRDELNQLMAAANVKNPTSESSFIGVRLIIDVRTVSDSFGTRNEPVSYRPYDFNDIGNSGETPNTRPW